MDKKYEDALTYFWDSIGDPPKGVKAALECMKFIQMVSDKKDPTEIITFLQTTLFEFRECEFPTLNNEGTREMVSVDRVASILAYEQVEECDLKSLLDDS